MATRVLILGGGFAGVFAAKQLARRASPDIEVELVSNANYFVFQPLLPEAAAGAIGPDNVATPLRLLLKECRVRQAEVMGVDLTRRTVSVVQGERRSEHTLSYDHLVLALGQVVDLSRIPGLAQHATTMKGIGDAFTLRTRMIGCLENADIEEDEKARKALLTFTVIGAGLSGTEVVGEVKAMIDAILPLYPTIRREEVRVVLIEMADRILPEMPPDLAGYAQRDLERRGVEVLLGTGVRSATLNDVELSDGRRIETRTILGTIGNAPSPLVEQLGLPLKWGKIVVDRSLRVTGHDNVWAIGDAALIPLVENPEEKNDFAPPSAQFAVREARRLALNIKATIDGRPPERFAYSSKGALASLGANKAIATVYGVKLSGFMAWLLWRGFYLSFMPGFGMKLRVFGNWLVNAVVSPQIIQARLRRPPVGYAMRVRKGDVVIDAHMVGDGLVAVMEGRVRRRIGAGPDEKIEEFGPGDQFGVLRSAGARERMMVEAIEDSHLFVLDRRDYEKIVEAFHLRPDSESPREADPSLRLTGT